MKLFFALLVGIAVGATVWNLMPSVHGLVTRFPLVLPEDQQFTATSRPVLAISPDGSRLVYVANGRLFLRSMGEMEAAPVPGLGDSNVFDPFFSPDGQWIGFFSQCKLKKVSINGGVPLTLCDAANGGGAFWALDNMIFFAPGVPGSRRPAISNTPQA